MTITKQRVEEIISRIEMYGHGAGYTVDEVYDLAVLALNLSNIANLKRYELDMDGCDSFGQDCGADMTEDPDGDYVLFDDVVKLFEFDTTTKKLETPATDAFLAEVRASAIPDEATERDLFEEWVMEKIFISKTTLEGLRTDDGYRNSTLSGTDYNGMWSQWKAIRAAQLRQEAVQ